MTCNISVSTVLRAVFRHPVTGFSTVKRLTAISTRKRTALITYPRAGRPWRKQTVTLFALADKFNIGDTSGFNQSGIVCPKVIILFCVTFAAKRFKVIEPVSLSIIIKKMIRLYVVNRETLANLAAPLTSIPVSLSGFPALLYPVRAAILRMTTKPNRIIFTTPGLGGSPPCPTFPIAKVMVGYLARLFLYQLSASITIDRYPLAAPAKAAFALPDSVTLGAAKPGFILHIRFYLKRLRANFTNQCFHNDIISHMDFLYKRTFCNDYTTSK